MKKIILSLLFISSISFAQNGINYQGAATDADGAKLVNQNISLKTSVLQGGVDGTTSYSETHNTTTDQFGLFNVVIGLGNIIEGSFDSIQWGADSHFLKVELDATGGTNYSLVSTTQMMNVPYALYAHSVNKDFIENTIDEINSEPENNDFNETIQSSDFDNNNSLDYIGEEFDEQNLLLFSTDKCIFFVDSSRTKTHKIYYVENDEIGFLTSSESSDSIFFLQSSANDAFPSIMMFTLNNLNPKIIGTIPAYMNEITGFEYKDGSFLYTRNGNIIRITNNSPYSFGWTTTTSFYPLDGSNFVHASYSGANVYLSNSAYSPGNYEYIGDIYADELKTIVYENQNGCQINLIENNNSTLIFDANSEFQSSGEYKYQNLHYSDNKIYFNIGRSLFSINEDGSDFKLINSSEDGHLINGIFSKNFNYIDDFNSVNEIETLDFSNNLIIFSTNKSIYASDLEGKNLQKIYSVIDNEIGLVTSNESVDTLYFLQAAHSSSSSPSIMQMSLINNEIKIANSIPAELQQINSFKYFNKKFYYIKDGNNFVIENNTPISIVGSNNVSAMVPIESENLDYSVIYAYYSGAGTGISNNSYSPSNYSYIADILIDENITYTYNISGDGQIIKAENYNSTVLFSNSGNYPSTNEFRNMCMQIHEDKIYFNVSEAIFSVDSNGENLKILTSPNDNSLINGIVIK
tara:strand:+ start:1062 stop:3134 length:2073 start_codon:yes stop_codon:yes gene_type:complete